MAIALPVALLCSPVVMKGRGGNARQRGWQEGCSRWQNASRQPKRKQPKRRQPRKKQLGRNPLARSARPLGTLLSAPRCQGTLQIEPRQRPTQSIARWPRSCAPSFWPGSTTKWRRPLSAQMRTYALADERRSKRWRYRRRTNDLYSVIAIHV